MRQCQQLCRLSREITHVIKINMFRDVSVFDSELRICQAAVSSSIHLTLIFHSCLFIDYSLNPFLLYIIIVVQILVVYVKCNEKLSPDRRYRVFTEFSLSAFIVVLTGHRITYRKDVHKVS